MTRTPIQINDRVARGDDLFRTETMPDGRLRLIPAPDEVQNEGTDVNANLMQPWEDVATAVTGSDAVQLKMLNSGRVVQLTYKGAYSNTAAYNKNDYVVSAQGNGFVAKESNTIGVTPPATSVDSANWRPCAW